jgi:predicted O-methyltransferase YrrM
VSEWSYQRNNSDLPWLTEDANNFLAGYLQLSDQGLEFGSGRSTLWFARHVHKLVSVEHDETWFVHVKDRLLTLGVSNVDYRRLPVEGQRSEDAALKLKTLLSDLEPEKYDFAIVDGVWREYCTQHAIKLLRPGGLLVIDNANRHLPSASRSPESRSNAQGADGPVWCDLAVTLSTWRFYWTSSGVTDTAFFFKPLN